MLAPVLGPDATRLWLSACNVQIKGYDVDHCAVGQQCGRVGWHYGRRASPGSPGVSPVTQPRDCCGKGAEKMNAAYSITCRLQDESCRISGWTSQ